MLVFNKDWFVTQYEKGEVGRTGPYHHKKHFSSKYFHGGRDRSVPLPILINLVQKKCHGPVHGGGPVRGEMNHIHNTIKPTSQPPGYVWAIKNLLNMCDRGTIKLGHFYVAGQRE